MHFKQYPFSQALEPQSHFIIYVKTVYNFIPDQDIYKKHTQLKEVYIDQIISKFYLALALPRNGIA